jgi:uncharacterized RDD family membrane protein YckC
MTPNYPNAQNVTYVAVPTDPLGRPFAGWWLRVAATLIDNILLFAVAMIILFAARGATGASLIALGGGVVYQAVMLASKGQTLGNMAASTVVVDAKTGAQVDAGRAWGRSAMEALISFGGGLLFGIPMLLDILWPLWDKQNQTLHDKVAGTVVVKKA